MIYDNVSSHINFILFMCKYHISGCKCRLYLIQIIYIYTSHRNLYMIKKCEKLQEYIMLTIKVKALLSLFTNKTRSHQDPPNNNHQK